MFEVYKADTEGEMRWHWRLLLGSGKRAIARSAPPEGFAKRSQVIADIARVSALAPVAQVVEVLT